MGALCLANKFARLFFTLYGFQTKQVKQLVMFKLEMTSSLTSAE